VIEVRILRIRPGNVSTPLDAGVHDDPGAQAGRTEGSGVAAGRGDLGIIGEDDRRDPEELA